MSGYFLTLLTLPVNANLNPLNFKQGVYGTFIAFCIYLAVFYTFSWGEGLVRSAISMAVRFKVSPSIIGLTIIAGGTSAPELVTSLIASFKGSSDIALGNVVGSNIFNILPFSD